MDRKISSKLLVTFVMVLFLFLTAVPYSEETFKVGVESFREVKLSRAKRNPFIVAFQVTRPPGLFQVSMRKPVIMNVMSNMTSMILGSELARMLSRGFLGQQFLSAANTTTS